MRAIWTGPAEEDRWKILDYLEERNPEAALNLDEEISRTVDRLEQFPKSGRIGRISRTREAVIGNYILVYEISGELLVITHLVHSAMEFPLAGR